MGWAALVEEVELASVFWGSGFGGFRGLGFRGLGFRGLGFDFIV